MDFVVTIFEQGLIYGILALGVYITYKILDFPDLTVDGSFPLGGAVTALLITKGINPYLSLGRGLHRADPCEGESKRFVIGNYYDDGSLDDQFVYSGNFQCTVVFPGQYL